MCKFFQTEKKKKIVKRFRQRVTHSEFNIPIQRKTFYMYMNMYYNDTKKYDENRYLNRI